MSVIAPLALMEATLTRMARDAVAQAPLVVLAIVVFIMLWLVAKGLRRLVERAIRRSSNHHAATAVGRIVFVAMLVLAALVSVTIAFPTMTPARLVSVLGVGGIAAGFAFKDIFQNLFAGILLLLRHPFRVGDEITTGEFTGTVESIEARATFIRTYDGKRVIIPNGDVYTRPVTVISAYDMLRTEYDVGIGYSDDLGHAREVALRVLSGIDGVLAEPGADVLVWDLGESAKWLRLRWWTRPARSEVLAVRDRVLKAVAEAMAEAGIDLPFPTQVMLFHDQTEEFDGDRTRQREGWPAGDKPPRPRARRISRPENRPDRDA